MAKEIKTLAVRLDAELHARLTILARLAAMPVADLVRWAVEDKLAAMASDPEIADRAEELRQAIEREAAEQRDALTGLFAPPSAPDPSGEPKSPGRSAKRPTTT